MGADDVFEPSRTEVPGYLFTDLSPTSESRRMGEIGHGHGHGHHPAPNVPHDPDLARRARIALAAIMGPLILATVVALALLWPRGPLPAAPGLAGTAYLGVQFEQAEVVALHQSPCQGDMGDRQVDGTIPKTTICHTVDATLTSGPEARKQITFGIAPDIARSGVHVGDRLQVVRYPAIEGQPVTYAFVDFAREIPLGILALTFAVLVVAVARLRGLMSLVGLILAFGMITEFVLPALRHREDPMLVAAVASTAIMIVILYLAHGITRKTTTALLGTMAGIWTSAGLAAVVTGAAHLTGLISEENIQLNRLTPFGDLSGLVVCGIILAGLGVLNDVTITQASAVWEFHQLAPHQPVGRLFAGGMQVGRDHLASIVYTLAFAYAGAALPSILLGTLYQRPLRQWLVSGEIAEEIARALVASVGLILTIPLTTAIGCVVVKGVSGWSTADAPRPDLIDNPGPARPLPAGLGTSRRRGRRAVGIPIEPPDPT